MLIYDCPSLVMLHCIRLGVNELVSVSSLRLAGASL